MTNPDRASGRRRPGVLRDRRLDARLERDGFVKVDLLDAASAADLRGQYGALHGWAGEGFVVDFWDPDPDYRRKASDAIDAVVAGPIRSMFVDHGPFLRNFLIKWPGLRDPTGFPEAPHRDWMYTDERAGEKSWVVWIALEDIDGHNGQLQVARGSHRVDDRIRGTNIYTEWLDHREVWEPRMLSIPVTAGQAVITDAATVHGSFSNLTEEPRVAVAVAVKATTSTMVHYRRVDDRRAAKYVLDEEFFLTQAAEALLERPPDLPIAEVVEIGGAELTAPELQARLDVQPLAWRDRLARRFGPAPETR